MYALTTTEISHFSVLGNPIACGAKWLSGSRAVAQSSYINTLQKRWTQAITRFTIGNACWAKAGASNTTMTTDDDDHLQMERIKSGDKNAVGVLYTRHHKRVFHFVMRFVNQSDLAEDVTNDVFIEIWQKANNYEGRSKVSSWILGIARYKALSEVRKKSHSAKTSDDVLETFADDADTPELTAQKVDKAAALKRCIAKLSADHRTILDLVYYHEKSIAEIASILDIPQNTVKTRTFHARKLLSAQMKSYGLDRGWP